MTPRYYQFQKMITPAMQAYRDGHKSVTVVGPTGSGKTSVIAWWAQQAAERGRNVLVLTHREYIQQQMEKTFHAFGLDPHLVYSGSSRSDNPLQIAMISTLINNLDSVPVPDWIIPDEFHHAAVYENMWTRGINHYKELNPDLKLLGLTATPQGRVNGKGLHRLSDFMVSDLTPEYLVSEGWLVYPHVMRGEKVEKLKFHITGGDYDRKEQREHFGKRKIVGNVIDSYRQMLDGLPIIVSCVSLEHAAFMAEQYNREARSIGKSWRAVMIQGGKKYQQQMFDALAGLGTGSVQVVCFVDVLGEGVDVPACAGIQLMRKMKSLVLYLQFIGRTLRPLWPEGFDQHNSTVKERLAVIAGSQKPQAEIQDFAGNFQDHGHPIDFRRWGLNDTRGASGSGIPIPAYTVCPACSAVWNGNPDTCRDCGADLHAEREHKAGRKLPKEIEGILIEAMPGSTPEQQIKAMVDKVLVYQKMPRGDLLRNMKNEVRKNGACDYTRGLAKAVGYSPYWVDTIKKKIRVR